MLGLTAADVNVHEFAHFGVRHSGIDTAVDNGGECVAFPLSCHVAFTYIHSRSEKGCRQPLACIFIHGSQFVGNSLVFGSFKEETDGIQVQRINYAVDAYTGSEIHTAGFFALRLYVRFYLLGCRYVHA